MLGDPAGAALRLRLPPQPAWPQRLGGAGGRQPGHVLPPARTRDPALCRVASAGGGGRPLVLAGCKERGGARGRGPPTTKGTAEDAAADFLGQMGGGQSGSQVNKEGAGRARGAGTTAP